MVHHKFEMLETNSWNQCDAQTSRAIASAKNRDVVKLPAASVNRNSTGHATFQMIFKTKLGWKLFVDPNNFTFRLFRPFPVFEINIKSTIGNLPGNFFEVHATAKDEATRMKYDIHARMPESSTINEARSIIRKATIDAGGVYAESNSQDKFACVITQFKNKKACLYALPILLYKGEVMKKPAATTTRQRVAKH